MRYVIEWPIRSSRAPTSPVSPLSHARSAMRCTSACRSAAVGAGTGWNTGGATPSLRYAPSMKIMCRCTFRFGAEPKRALGQYLVRQQRGDLGHPARATGRTEPALLAAEGDELLGVALLAVQAQETLLEPAALEVGVELRLDVVGQGAACLGAQLAEDGIALLDQLVEQRRLGAVTRVARWVDEGRGARSRRAGGGRGGVHRACSGSRRGLAQATRGIDGTGAPDRLYSCRKCLCGPAGRRGG